MERGPDCGKKAMSFGKSISMFECLLIDKCSCCVVDNGQGTVSDEKRAE